MHALLVQGHAHYTRGTFGNNNNKQAYQVWGQSDEKFVRKWVEKSEALKLWESNNS